MSKPIPKRVEDFAAKYVPGLRVYLQRENTRDFDKMVRDELVKKILELIKEFDSAKQAQVDQGKLMGLDVLDRVSGRLQKVADTIKFSSRGYSGMFDLEVVGDEELKRMLEFDQNLFDHVQALSVSLKEALARPENEMKAAVTGFEGQIKTFEAQLDGRDAYMKNRKTK